jgi:hypothetical protein|eukprot:3352692-Prymnesium_polylepis.2
MAYSSAKYQESNTAGIASALSNSLETGQIALSLGQCLAERLDCIVREGAIGFHPSTIDLAWLGGLLHLATDLVLAHAARDIQLPIREAILAGTAVVKAQLT